MKKSQNLKKTIITCTIFFVIYLIIFFVTQNYIKSNELLFEKIQMPPYGLFIILATTAAIDAFVFLFEKIAKIFVMYTSILLVFLMSLYEMNFEHSLKCYLIRVAFVIVYFVLLKFAFEKLEKLDKKFSINQIFFIYFLFHIGIVISGITFFDFVPTILVMNKFYFTFKKDNFYSNKNYEIVITLLLFAIIFKLYYSVLFYLGYDLKKKITKK